MSSAASTDVLLTRDLMREILGYVTGSYLYTGTISRLWRRLYGESRHTTVSEGVASVSRAEEIKFYRISDKMFNAAARNGRLDVMKVLKTKTRACRYGCPWSPGTFENAARIGNLDNMKWLKANGCPWDSRTFDAAAKKGDLDNTKWLERNGCPRS
jgi:hypothetical protein